MSWVQAGVELPTLNEHGERPELDDEGLPRQTELVVYEGLKDYEFDVSDMARVSDRRWLESVIQSLTRQRPLSTVMALDYEDVYAQVCQKFIRAVRHVESGKEVTGKDAQDLLQEAEWDDVFAILQMVRRQAQLSQRKKKNWSCRFGLPTS